MDTILAKFKVTGVTESKYHKDSTIQTTVKLSAVYDSTLSEDRTFSKATPSGELSMVINNEAALAFFELGQDYYLHFTRTPKE